MCGKFAYIMFWLKWAIKKNYCTVICLKLKEISVLQLTILYRRAFSGYTHVRFNADFVETR
jgi:hypothetical protein